MRGGADPLCLIARSTRVVHRGPHRPNDRCRRPGVGTGDDVEHRRRHAPRVRYGPVGSRRSARTRPGGWPVRGLPATAAASTLARLRRSPATTRCTPLRADRLAGVPTHHRGAHRVADADCAQRVVQGHVGGLGAGGEGVFRFGRSVCRRVRWRRPSLPVWVSRWPARRSVPAAGRGSWKMAWSSGPGDSRLRRAAVRARATVGTWVGGIPASWA